jgi:hypothetical protein
VPGLQRMNFFGHIGRRAGESPFEPVQKATISSPSLLRQDLALILSWLLPLL